jgi:hypothetical protein
MAEAGMPPDPWQAQLLRSTDPRVLMLCARQVPDDVVSAASPTMAVSKGRFVALSTAFAKSG